MKRWLFLIAIGLLACMAVRPQQQTATATGTVVNPAAGSLLTGCTFTGAGGCAVPGGWQLVMQQDFECTNSHANPANSSCAGSGLPSNEWFTQSGAPTQFQTDQAHTGSNSWGSQYYGDAAAVNFGYQAIGNYTTIYGSYWVWDSTNAMAGNSDFFLFELIIPTGGTSSACWIAEDAEWFGNPATASTTVASEFVGAAPDASGICGGNFLTNQGFTYNMPAGAWHQIEFEITPSTVVGPGNPAFPPPNCNSLTPTSSGCGNGALSVWIDGTQVQHILNADLNGTVNWNNAALSFGGLITSWSTGGDNGSNPRCSVFGSNGTPNTASTNASPSQCNGTQPGTGSPQPFDQRIDDVILIKQ